MRSDSLDANLIVHYILGDVPGQRERVNKLLETPNTIHYVEDLALSEAVYVFEKVYRQARPVIINQLNFFFTHFSDCIVYNRGLTALVYPMYLECPKLSFNDCCLASYAEMKHAEPLFTFDRKLAKQTAGAKLL